MMLGNSKSLLAAKTLLDKFSACDIPILIEGETGTGKELAARLVHYASPRRNMPFIPVNCGAIPDALVENEFFGHRRGAYTDASEDHRGLVSLAEGGTLFLDEIDALSSKAQVCLLRFLQDHIYRQVGSETSRVAQVRIVAATNSDLSRLVDAGTFRSDLLFRLRVLHVLLPPLRQRVDDIPALARHFVSVSAKHLQLPPKCLRPELIQMLERYSWPGNVRELESLICRAFLLADGPEIGLDAAPDLLAHNVDDLSPIPSTSSRFNEAKAEAISRFEVEYLSQLMTRTGGNVTLAAKLAGTERRHLGRLLKKHQIARPHLSARAQ